VLVVDLSIKSSSEIKPNLLLLFPQKNSLLTEGVSASASFRSEVECGGVFILAPNEEHSRILNFM